jgi:predicted nucleic acid-binding protein
VLIDTNVLIRTLQPHHPLYVIADRAVQRLPEEGTVLHIVPQNLTELWVVATRTVSQNGLGMTPSSAAAELARLKDMFILLPETPAIYPAWEELVVHHQVSGKPAHDARLVAAMRVHDIKAILTFDKSGFARYPDIQVVHPEEVIAS